MGGNDGGATPKFCNRLVTSARFGFWAEKREMRFGTDKFKEHLVMVSILC